jgi:hypothetical protein
VTEASPNQQKIQNLATKLGVLDEVLTPEERSILIGILGTASSALADVTSQSEYGAQPTDANPDAVSPEVETIASQKLSDAFQLYFTPGHAGRFTVPPGLNTVIARVIRG